MSWSAPADAGTIFFQVCPLSVESSKYARHVIGAGDGFADRCLARSADSIWARDGSYLHRWCVENRVAHTPFTSLDGVARAVAAFPA